MADLEPSQRPDGATTVSSVPGTAPRKESPFTPFKHAGYRLLWTIGLLSGSAFQMQQVVNRWLVYELTRDPVQLGLIGAFQAVPLVVLSLFGGAMADKVDRRRLLIVTQAVRTSLALLLLLLAAVGHIQVWHIYLITLMTSSATVFEGPTRQAILPTMVPRSTVTNALVLNASTNQLTRSVGPAIAGLFLAVAAGPALAYGVNFVLFCLSWLTVWRLKVPHITGDSTRRGVVSMMGQGLSFVRATPVILGLLLLDFCATFFSAYQSLLPVFAKEVLHVGPGGYGALEAAPSIGAFLGSLGVLFLFNGMERKGRAILTAVFLYGLAILSFSLSPVFGVSFLCLVVAGMLDQTAVTMRNSVLLLLTPTELRGRVESIRLIFIQGGPTLGAVQAGFFTSLVGAPITLAVQSGLVLAAAGIIRWRVPGIWKNTVR